MKASLSLVLIAGAGIVQGHGQGHGFLHRRAQTTSAEALSSPDKPTLTGTVTNCNQWYDVIEGDSCWAITQDFGITQAQFEAWNPAVGSTTCVVEIGVSYCVGVGSVVSTTTTTSSSITSSSSGSASSSITGTGAVTSTITSNSTTTTSYSTLSYNTTTNPVTITDSTWPPTRTQSGQPSYSKNGDTCQSIALQHSTWMDQSDFLDWNPAVGENCTSIYYGYWYCIGIKPQTSVGYNQTAVPQWYPTWSYTAPAAMDTVFSPTPAQSGLASDCQVFYITDEGDTCASIVASQGFLTEEEFLEWNPAVGADCSNIEKEYYYCIWNGTTLPLPSTTNALPSPVQSGITSSCTAWYQASDGDNCDLIPEEFGTFSKSDFLNWNPAVQTDCSGLVMGDYYCVAVPGTPTTRTASAVTLPTPATPSDTISTCSDYWLVGTNDNCTTIADANGILVATLETWNPSLKSDCSGLSSNTYICVGIPSNDTSTTSSTIATAITTSGAATPSPTQEQTGMTSDCIRFYKVETDDSCYAIAQDAGIALSDFYSWNPALDGDCTGLQANVYVCIGKSGYATTITTGTPIPVTPTPTQTGMVTGCLRFFDVQSGEGCSDIASEAGIALSDFYSWNPAVSTNCAGLQASVFVCVGTTGPITTITSGTPVPAETTN
ncbi:uncharacterized protein N7482_009853 [Penicillium canariense]|uniref:LysM domain-containing protein n=1 Tax=Penicillium canariense TaxID=189055 RepID=A0A9W9HRB3_9EURO|nr:uncharacterized protein N7482_009853 [Penicillium canariense]KAJ5153375.1 hypothetical protein N7482_009853 [Penicillium canariense]